MNTIIFTILFFGGVIGVIRYDVDPGISLAIGYLIRCVIELIELIEKEE